MKTVYGAVSMHGEIFYTYMDKVFGAIEQEQLNYNWLITNREFYCEDDKVNEMFEDEYCWLSGEELTKLVSEHNFQWIWGDFLGFKKDVLLEDVLKYPITNLEDYDYFKNPLCISNPLASIEIISEDSFSTIIMSEEKRIVDNFMKNYPSCKGLEKFNEE